MDLYTVVYDSAANTYKRTDLIEGYYSAIWTERYGDVSDFEVKFDPSNSLLAYRLSDGGFISQSETQIVMQVESVTIAQDENGVDVATATGRGLEGPILENRQLFPGLPFGGISYLNIGQQALEYVLVPQGSGYSQYDSMADLQLFIDTAYTTFSELDITTSAQSILDYLKTLASSGLLGFEVYTQPTSQPLVLHVWEGQDKPGIVFSSDDDTLANPSFVTSSQNFKNVAYVAYTPKTAPAHPELGGESYQTFTIPGLTNSQLLGLNRRTMRVDATDISEANYSAANLAKVLNQRAQAALASQKKTSLVDGEIGVDVKYVFKDDYNLGDFVRVKGPYSPIQKAQVTEYIWSSDATGNKQYPTFDATPVPTS